MSDNVFAERLDYLLRTSKRPDGSRYTYDVIVELSGGQFTRGYLSQLRQGKAKPGYDVIVALADVFNVHPGYFFKRSETTHPSHQDDFVERLALRSAGLDEQSKNALLVLLDSIKGNNKDVQ